MVKLISPSSAKGIQLPLAYVEFNKAVLSETKLFAKNYRFVGNVVHKAYELIVKDNVAFDYAIFEAFTIIKSKNALDYAEVKDSNTLVKVVIKHHLNYLMKTIGNLKQDNELGFLTKLKENLYLGGTADILLHNTDNTYTIADIKNYSNPKTSSLREHYRQTLLYSFIAEQNGYPIKDIQIVYPAQEQVVTLPYNKSLLNL